MNRPKLPRWKINTDYVAAFAVTAAPLVYFLPAFLNHVILGPDDGRLFNVPLRVATAQLLRSGYFPIWNPYIFGGMPLLGSAQGGLLFPLNWFYLIFSSAVATDLMVVTTYMFAALGAYLFARRTGASVGGAVITSIVWQSGGFLLAQISHINIVNTAAVLPWVLWSLEHYVADGSKARGLLLALIVAIQVFAGHQQTFAYSILLVWAYAITMSFGNSPRRKRYLTALAFTAAGILLASVQILPTAELLRNSLRASATYEFFSSFSMPRNFLPTLLAPYLLGGGDKRLFRAPYIGQLYYTEYVAYAGVLSIMLLMIALSLRRDKQTLFWTAVVVLGFLLALGRNAPVGFNRLIYLVPVINLFRVPARHLQEVNFAIAILAGRGFTFLGSQRKDKKTLVLASLVGGAVFVATCLLVTVWRPANFQLAREAPVTLLRAPELFMPIVMAVLSLFALWWFVRRRRGATALLLTVLIVDLWSWGQFSGWYVASRGIPKEFWGVPESVTLLREKTPKDPASYRILTTQQPFDPGTPLPNTPATGWSLWTEPDVYEMYGIQNAAGYDGFGLERYMELAGQMKLWGELSDPNTTLRSDSREIDLLNVRYLVARRNEVNELDTDLLPAATTPTEPAMPLATENYGGVLFGAQDLGLPRISGGEVLSFKTPAIETTRIALLTNLSFAEAVPDNAVVARLQLKSQGGRTFDFALRAGVETADWAYDRPDIRQRIQHRRPSPPVSYNVKDAQYSYQGHKYVAVFDLPEKVALESGTIEVGSQWPGMSLGVLRVSLQGDRTYELPRAMMTVKSQSGLTPVDSEARWRLIAEGEKVKIFENSRPLPRVWLASEARVLDDAEMLKVIRSGALPERKWNPSTTVLVESAPGINLEATSPGDYAQIKRYEPNRIEIGTQTSGNSIMVLGENYYPGWQAYVDGQSVAQFRVNYALRGIVLRAGRHQVVFLYRPWSVIGGALISLVTLAGLVSLCFTRNRS